MSNWNDYKEPEDSNLEEEDEYEEEAEEEEEEDSYDYVVEAQAEPEVTAAPFFSEPTEPAKPAPVVFEEEEEEEVKVTKQPEMLQTASKAYISNKHRSPKARKYLPVRTRHL